MHQHEILPSGARDIEALGNCIANAASPQLWRVDLENDDWNSEIYRIVRESFSASQWDLVERMRERDPAQRPNIAYVVSQLKQFASGNESIDAIGETSESTSPQNQSQRIGDTYSPKLDMSIDEALESITMTCASIPETHWLREKVSPAVEYLYKLIQDREMHENDDAVLQFCALLARVRSYIRTAKSEASVARLARSQQVAESHHVLDSDLDRLLDILDVPTSDPIRTWTRSNEDIEKHLLRSGHEVEAVSEESATTTETVSLKYYDDEQASQALWSTGTSASSAKAPSWYLALREVVFSEERYFIGKGAFGRVYKGSWLGTPVVVKFMGYEEDPDTVTTKLFLHEVRVWHQLDHPHIVKLYGASHVDKRYFVCEYAPNGNLLEYLKKRKASNNSKHEMWQKLHEVALGLQHMHSLNIVHNDLKCDNILVGANGEAKIIDFGLSSLPNTAEI
ncbi:Serine/threonine-protein phosphatase 6 regulatory ankyrin repeat subunit, partial [Globisporangium polare]